MASSFSLIGFPSQGKEHVMHYPFGMLAQHDSLYIRFLKANLMVITLIALGVGLLVGNLFNLIKAQWIILLSISIVEAIIVFSSFRHKIRYRVDAPKQMTIVFFCRAVLFTRAFAFAVLLSTFEWWWQIITVVIFFGCCFIRWLSNHDHIFD